MQLNGSENLVVAERCDNNGSHDKNGDNNAVMNDLLRLFKMSRGTNSIARNESDGLVSREYLY